MIGISGVGNTPGERTMRTSPGPLSTGISQSRIMTSGDMLADFFQRDDAIAGLGHVSHADVTEQIAHDGAHEGTIVDHQNMELLESGFGGLEVYRHGTVFRPRHSRARSLTAPLTCGAPRPASRHIFARAHVASICGSKPAVEPPLRGKTVEIRAQAGRPSGQIGRAQSRGFHHRRAIDRTMPEYRQETAWRAR